jgi:hypothetical protein
MRWKTAWIAHSPVPLGGTMFLIYKENLLLKRICYPFKQECDLGRPTRTSSTLVCHSNQQIDPNLKSVHARRYKMGFGLK